MPQLKITNGFTEMTDIDFLGKVRFVLQQMTINAVNFPSPDPDLATITTLANEFERDIQEAEAGGSYDRSVRDNKKQELIDNMHYLSNYVLFVAKGRRLIAESSGFTITKEKSPKPPIEKPVQLVLTDGINARELQLLFAKVHGAKSYMYQISTDPSDETKWITAYGTVRKNLFTRLESGKKYYVRVVALGTKGQIVYSDVVARIAQ
jgi:hypothetical protein